MKLRELIDRQSVQGGRRHKAHNRRYQQIQPGPSSEDNSIKIEGKSSKPFPCKLAHCMTFAR